MTIHWWNTDKLVERLTRGDVSEKEAVWYAMIAAALYTQATYFAAWFGGYRSWMPLYEFVVVTIISLFGVNECFKANGGTNGVDFLKRLSVISAPVGIKLMIVGIILGWLGYYAVPHVITAETFRNPAFVYDLYAFAFSTAFMGIFYWRIVVHLSRLSDRLKVA